MKSGLKNINRWCLLFILIAFSLTSKSQNNPFKVSLRIPIQYEWQQASAEYSWGQKILKATQANYGIDLLLSKRPGKTIVFGGVGYFRHKVNIQRPYNWQVLNPSQDSLAFSLTADNYTYSLARIPLGVKYTLPDSWGIVRYIGIEHLFNFSFSRKYQGPKYPGSENKRYSHANYFGNSVNLMVTFSAGHKRETLLIEPYVRIYNKHKKDFLLFEREYEKYTRWFDAIGANFTYTF